MMGNGCDSKRSVMMQELEQLEALVRGWEMAVADWQGAGQIIQGAGLPGSLGGQFALMQAFVPIESVVIQYLHSESKSLKVVGYGGSASAVALEETTVECSDAKWLGVEPWCRSGEILHQAGAKRAGKLSVLTPKEFTNEVFAIPLRPKLSESSGPNAVVGAAVFEIPASRVLREDHFRLLERWSPILWLWMERSVRVRWPERFGDGIGNVSSTFASESKDEAREAIVGSETGLRAVMDRVRIVAPSDMPVLILGETGTGKEVVARAIHGRSPRRAKPFIRVNCGAIPTELIDSQLFGHERGSFTGASDQRKGWFERADGGTLFLDEIGELPLAAQVRLLRVLQDHQIERVGGQEHIHVDVRIVAATHRDLSAMVHSRSFREDLWYRINMFPILLPGLRERVEDIPSLARHFAKRAANRFGLPYVEPTLADIKLLMDYRWPGNIRELQAIMDRAVILGGGTRLDVAMSLGNTFLQAPPPSSNSDEPTFYEVIPESTNRNSATAPVPSALEDEGPVDSLDSAIVRHIERALAAASGQVEGRRGAAQLLGVNPHTLRAKMRKLGIDWDRFRR